MLTSAFPLHQVAEGRVFARAAPNGLTLVFGVVQAPADAPFERVVMARLNSHLWLDLGHPLENESIYPHGRVQDLRECDVSSLLCTINFRKHLLPDAFDVFVRKTHMHHEDPAKQWVIVAGVAPGRLSAISTEGLYELGPSSLSFTGVSQSSYPGTTPSIILRDPLWGPGGRYGLATSMDPEVYEQVIKNSRERPLYRDPEFERFLTIYGEGRKLPMVYTRDQLEEHEAHVARIVREMVGSEFDDQAVQPDQETPNG
jgi:hypothetical protein